MAEHKFPTEVIDLPSQGKVYPKDSVLADGKLELKYMTTKEEDILMSSNLIKKGVVIDKLIDSLIVTKGVNQDDLVLGDKNAILVAARILAYGPEYTCKVSNPNNPEQQVEHTFDLSQCPFKETIDGVDYSKNSFEYTDEFLDEILNKLKELKKLNLSKVNNSEFSIQFRSIFGKSFGDNEISSILELNDENFEKKIKDIFFNKRSKREEILNKDQALELEKRILLQLIDQNWKSHIQYLEQLRGVIGLRSYGNRDPLIEYKKEAFSLFENLLFKIKSELITVLINLEVIEKKEESQKITRDENLLSKKVGRNEPCPCGSGKKYKHCHGSI